MTRKNMSNTERASLTAPMAASTVTAAASAASDPASGTEKIVATPGTAPADALTPENTPALEPAGAQPAMPSGTQAATPMQADASPALRDTATAEIYARSDIPAIEATVGTMLPDVIVDEDVPRLAVACHVEGGRRRGGRRWPQGETIIPQIALSDYEWQQILGDPRFAVRPVKGN